MQIQSIPGTQEMTSLDTAYPQVTDIISIEGTDEGVELLFRSGKSYVSNRPLQEFERLLGRFDFFRTHLFYIINLREIACEIGDACSAVKMSDGRLIPLSPGRRNELKEIKKQMISY